MVSGSPSRHRFGLPFGKLFGLLLAAAIVALFFGCAASTEQDGADATAEAQTTVVYLVRHAEKRTDQGDDPELTAAGEARAEALAERFEGETVDQIYATQYRRTQLTVEPLARRLGHPVKIEDAGAVAELAQKILSEHRGEIVLVCAHSNTVPSLASELGSPEEITIPDERYGDLFVLRIAGDTVALERQHVGD